MQQSNLLFCRYVERRILTGEVAARLGPLLAPEDCAGALLEAVRALAGDPVPQVCCLGRGLGWGGPCGGCCRDAGEVGRSQGIECATTPPVEALLN